MMMMRSRSMLHFRGVVRNSRERISLSYALPCTCVNENNVHINSRLQDRRSISSSRIVCSSNNDDGSSVSGSSNGYSLYMWGTSVHGSIPLSSSAEDESSSSSSNSILGGLQGRGGSNVLWDHPQQVEHVEMILHDNDNKNKETPSVTSIACGQNNTAAVLSDGTCLTWGANEHGQLGHGHTDHVTTPTALDLPSNLPIASAALHQHFSAVVSRDGDLYTFGHNGSALAGGLGCLGHGAEASYHTPKLVESLVEDGCAVRQVTLGESHLTVLTTEAEVLTAGAGSYGRLGNLEAVDQLWLEPVELLSPPAQNVTRVATGHAFTMALTDDGSLHGWGRNDKGQLGDGGGLMVDMYAMENLPRPIEGQLEGRRVTDVDAGYQHTACVTESGELFVWGMGLSLEPVLVNEMLNEKCVAVACGQNYTLVLTEDGKLYSFGNGKTGVLGHANTKTINSPQLVEGLLGKRVVQMAAGFQHCAVLVEEDDDDE